MKVSSKTIGSWPRLNRFFDRNGEEQKDENDELPMRLEIFSSEQMEQHAKTIASMHKVSSLANTPELLKRLAENKTILIKVRNLLMEAIQSKQGITPAGEWLVNNFYLIEEQIRTAKRHFPKGYSRELPHLLNGPSAGLPRVYDIVLQTISHSDGRVDPDSLRNFVAAYQKVTSLTLGELWAIPIMLRLALIENLRRIAVRVAASRYDRNRADHWVNQITGMAEKDPKNLILVIADMARSNPPMTTSFVAEFAHRLHGQSPVLTLPLSWLEQQLSEIGLTIEQSIQMENQKQAAEQVFIGNIIGSLRFLSAMDWREFVEAMSIVEQILREDPSKIYSKMDFATRDHYRHVVEKIAKRGRQSESEIARNAIHLAHQVSISQGTEARTAHVGFYLIDKGVLELKRKVKVWLSIPEVLQQMNPLFFYLGMISVLTITFTLSLLKAQAGILPGKLLILVGIPLLFGTSQLAVSLVNWLMTLLVTPEPLPRLDFSKGIPPESQALVVVPTLLNNSQNIKNLLEEIEVRFLANRDENLQFGLLTDFTDALSETMPGDELLLQQAQKGIEALNEKYKSNRGSIFFLFHRPRRKNAQEKVWMGYERKRGKLADLNALLRGNSQDPFSSIVGEINSLSSVKYVITLDTDTQLPRDSARQFIGAMAHPLNRAYYDNSKQRVSTGYGILQPRVGVSLPGTNRSRYAQLYGSQPGIDPYTLTTSDVYQDVFEEGSFIGKGIYDVDVFEQALKGRFPENRILSHDLLEGCYVRAGLLSDVLLYEEYPANYQADVSRRHRWIRGDWQIASWLLPYVPGLDKSSYHNPLSGLSRWKIFDNLRRSLVAMALTLLLLIGWTALPSSWFWTSSVIGILLVPLVLASILDIFRKPNDMLISQHISAIISSASRSLAQTAFMLMCLPYEAVFSLDAIVRTIGQLLFTHKGLLEWNPSSNSHQHIGITSYFQTMWSAPFIAIAVGAYLMLLRPNTLAMASPILGLWLISPAIAWWISQPLIPHKAKLTDEQTFFLQKLSRKTWTFFETFVNEEENWLPPDNYQEHPVPVVAHRTSPTNIGFALLANLSAYDFGYISTGQFIERTSKTFNTMATLERHRGHFYNWYDTKSLTPLPPLYISSVDSGNLSGHLLTLRQGLLSLPDQKILQLQLIKGLSDTFKLLVDALGGYVLPQLMQIQKEIELTSHSWPTTTLNALQASLSQLVHFADEIIRSLETKAGKTDKLDKVESPATAWAYAFVRQCQDALNELNLLAPWVSLPVTANFGLNNIPTLRELSKLEGAALPTSQPSPEFQRLLSQASQRAQSRISAIQELAKQANEFAQIEYDFLFDETRHLLAIGYNVSEHRRDASFYDLLASEARLCTFVGIAQGHLPQESWFSLGRLLTIVGSNQVLVSWSGSIFEYLMPLLIMPTYENSLLDQTYKTAIKAQIEYGRKRGIPWGVSESGYNMFDTNLNYQYHAFGVPSLGLNPSLAEDTVIAPYASMLALMVAPEEACVNLQRLTNEGFEGKYGFYEAIDYTPLRLPRGQTNTVIRSYMAHHGGMSFLALAYLLLDQPMQRRFEAEPLFQATTLLLQERVPKASAFYAPSAELTELHTGASELDTIMRIFRNPNRLVPEVQLLSNGKYRVMVTSAGGGYSQWKDIAVTRWREDSTSDNWGTFCYIRNLASGEFWSNAYQPTIKHVESYEAIFSEAQAEFRCRNQGLDTHTEIVVSSEDDIELRRIRITNFSQEPITIDITSYAEVVLNSLAADMLHPAFSNLFVQTEILHQRQAIICTRRPRSQNEQSPWMFHLMAVHGAEVEEVSYETDRMEFIGRGNTVANPKAMRKGASLSGSEGSVLDPIVSIRSRITLEPENSATINIISGISETHDLCLGLVEKYQDWRIADRVFDLNWAHSQVVLRQLNATEAETHLYGRLASSIIYANASLRADSSTLVKNQRGQSSLWGYSISGDLPIVLLKIGDPSNIDLVRQLVQAHAYWRLKGLIVDLMIWKEDYTGYRQLLHEQIMRYVTESNMTDRPGGIFVRPADQMSEEDRILVQSVARVIISDRRGTLAEQLLRRSIAEVIVPRLVPSRTHRDKVLPTPSLPRNDLIFFNGLGGFTADGREYIITTAQEQQTPAPWVNVLANPYFGTVISESGSGYTWSENAHEFRLTPWCNDPVSDASGEAFYIRDEERGHYWSPTPLPSRGLTPYISRHGFGYSIFEHSERNIRSELKVYVALDAPVKFMVFKIANLSERSRRISLTGYVEWILGDLRSKSTMHVITELDPNTGAMFARNSYNTEFPGRIAFFDVNEPSRTITGDRTEFIGRNNTLQNPVAMTRSHLSGKIGAALDPCGALQVAFNLTSGEEREFIFILGVGRDATEASNLIQRFRGSEPARKSLEAIWEYWKKTLGAVYIETPDQSLNILANGWLLYQTLACRLWARSGFYQSGGAFGFRDQLQDVMALIHTKPLFMREHLLNCAARQFPEGDVQHWWHPPLGRGVRTHCSDDLLWLPLVTCRYVLSTGDTGVLEEPCQFLTGRLVNAEEESYYDMPGRSEKVATLYEHCVLAILKGLNFGSHGLPLIGSGDWNDGMNLIGEHGKGESIWLGFFLYDVLIQFSTLARNHKDISFAERCEKEASQLRQNLDQNGWDNEWYRRAYFDDGSPLGSAGNIECKIDSISQSWAVLSGAGKIERTHIAMEAVDKYLVNRESGLIQLLEPPFDSSSLNPGYIKGYVPGIRENGGQYTHAAIWTIMAFAALGDSQRAWELFSLINPVNHGKSPEAIANYKVEPYVVAADVYAVSPHTGRGGWTWYTGSAGWMYRLILESFLGLRLEIDKLHFTPCLPKDWSELKVHYRYRETFYHITIQQISDPNSSIKALVDGLELDNPIIQLVDDHKEHLVKISVPIEKYKGQINVSELVPTITI